MPTRPPRLCPTCNHLITTPRCPTCQPAWANTTRPGSTRAWRRLRLAVFAEQDGTCNTPGCTNPTEELDHINGWEQGDHRTNVQGLCRPCHDDKTRREATHARHPPQPQ